MICSLTQFSSAAAMWKHTLSENLAAISNTVFDISNIIITPPPQKMTQLLLIFESYFKEVRIIKHKWDSDHKESDNDKLLLIFKEHTEILDNRDLEVEVWPSYFKPQTAVCGFTLTFCPYLGLKFVGGSSRGPCLFSFIHFYFSWEIVFKFTFPRKRIR